MKLGIGITTFPWPAEEIGPAVSRIATAADEADVDSLWVMDHFFQIRLSGLPPESAMPEAYATLAFLGGLTQRIRLGTLVTSVAYRHPGVLVKTVTSLDVLTGGRVIFGVGEDPKAGAGALLDHLRELATVGIDHVLASPRSSWDEATFEAIASILPEVHAIEPVRG